MAIRDIVLEVNSGVKIKNKEGSLKIYTNKIEWKKHDSIEVDNIIKYEDIKSLKISPEVFDKLYLRIVLLSGAQYTLHFISNDSEKDSSNRNKVKSLISKLMTVNKKEKSSELSLEEKNMILSSDIGLYNIYKELVVSNIISSDEFWSSPFLVKGNLKIFKTKKAIPNGFWSMLVPISKGCNEISLNLTPECINAIYTTYPLIKTKYDELVPDKLSQKDFWSQFFNALYYYRDKSKNIKNMSNFFIDIFKQAEVDFINETKSTDYEELQSSILLPQGYGGIFVIEDNDNLNFCQKFNLQSRIILKTFQNTTVDVHDINKIKNCTSQTQNNDENSIELDLAYDKYSFVTNYEKKSDNILLNNDNIISYINDWENNNYKIAYINVFKEHAQKDNISNVIEDDSKLKIVTKSIMEMLRLYWSTFPINQSNFSKLHKRLTSVQNYYSSNVLPLISHISDQTNFIQHMVLAAEERFKSTSLRINKK